MISKHRNRGILMIVWALVMTGALGYLFYDTRHVHRVSQNRTVLWILVALIWWALWFGAGFSLARAKGYEVDTTSGLFVFLLFVSFFIPVAVFVFPATVIFVLKDKTHRGHSRHSDRMLRD